MLDQVTWLQNLTHNIDWLTLLVRVLASLTFAILLFVARYVFKIFKAQIKAIETNKTLEKELAESRVRIEDLSNERFDSRRKIERVIEDNRKMSIRLETLEDQIEINDKLRMENARLNHRVSQLEIRIVELESVQALQIQTEQTAVNINIRKGGTDELKELPRPIP
jgi:predicted RNase H-like nuclease (RuvC/YqgF family)